MIKILCGFAAGTFYGVIASTEIPALSATIMKFLLKMALSSMGG